jgi:UDP-N-acetylmuramyl pentapeptide phosphotransferase/UDP-N-acetylglucosamine-1-phosphate transferase
MSSLGYFVWVVMQKFLEAMLVCSILILLFRRVAFRLDIADRPGNRRQHGRLMRTMDGVAGKTTLITILGVATIIPDAGEDGLLPLTLALPGLMRTDSFDWLCSYTWFRRHSYSGPI